MIFYALGQGIGKHLVSRVVPHRMPLPSLTVVADEAPKLRPFKAVIADELNVREVILTEQAAASEGGFGVRQVVQVQRAGRLGRTSRRRSGPASPGTGRSARAAPSPQVESPCLPGSTSC
jgi:hypothetical protein